MKSIQNYPEEKFAGSSFNISPVLEELPIPTIPKGYKVFLAMDIITSKTQDTS